MPELSWTTALAWFGVLSGATSLASLVFGLVIGRQTSRLQVDIHTATQSTLTDMRKGFTESQQAMAEALSGIS